MLFIRIAAVVGLLFVPSLVDAGESRTWTDQQGRQIEAELVRVFNGSVIFEQNGRVLRVPLSNLCAADQAFISNQGKEQANEENELPAIDRPAEAQRRTWTDTNGNQVEATFVRVHDGQIVLTVGGRVKTFGVDDFSSDDQNYVMQELAAQGKQAQADAMQRYLASRQQTSENVAAASRPSGPSAPPFMENDPFAAMRRQRDEMNERMRQQEAEQERIRQEAMATNSQPSSRAPQPTNRQPQVASASSGSGTAHDPYGSFPTRSMPVEREIPSYTPPDFNQADQYVEEPVCSGCNKVVPRYNKAGDTCPYCGVYWSTATDVHGNTEYASESEEGFSMPRARSLRGIVWLILAVGGGIAAGFRKLMS